MLKNELVARLRVIEERCTSAAHKLLVVQLLDDIVADGVLDVQAPQDIADDMRLPRINIIDRLKLASDLVGGRARRLIDESVEALTLPLVVVTAGESIDRGQPVEIKDGKAYVVASSYVPGVDT